MPQFPVDSMLQALRKPLVPVMTLEISTFISFPCDLLINMVQSLPELHNITLGKSCYEVFQLFKGRLDSGLIWKQFPFTLGGLLIALGRCKEMTHI
jgi:hypothetical protein